MITGHSRLRFLLCAGFGLWIFSAGAANAAWGLGELMQSLAQVKNANASFVERKFMKILNAPLDLSGTLVYTAPSHLEKHTLKPHAESLVLDGNTLVIEDKVKKRRRTLSIQEYPVIWALVESIRSTLAGDLQGLNRFYQVRFEGTEREWRLFLTPRDATVKRFLEEIRVSGAGTSLRLVEIRETEGDRSFMTISESPA